MTQETEKRVVAFVRVIANRCCTCLYRRDENCSRCDSRTATRLIRNIELDVAVPPKDYSLFARMKLIVDGLKRAKRPLLSSEIVLDGICSNQLKQWTLKRLIRLGVVGRRSAFKTRTGYQVYRYFLTTTKETKDERDEQVK